MKTFRTFLNESYKAILVKVDDKGKPVKNSKPIHLGTISDDKVDDHKFKFVNLINEKIIEEKFKSYLTSSENTNLTDKLASTIYPMILKHLKVYAKDEKSFTKEMNDLIDTIKNNKYNIKDGINEGLVDKQKKLFEKWFDSKFFNEIYNKSDEDKGLGIGKGELFLLFCFNNVRVPLKTEEGIGDIVIDSKHMEVKYGNEFRVPVSDKEKQKDRGESTKEFEQFIEKHCKITNPKKYTHNPKGEKLIHPKTGMITLSKDYITQNYKDKNYEEGLKQIAKFFNQNKATGDKELLSAAKVLKTLKNLPAEELNAKFEDFIFCNQLYSYMDDKGFDYMIICNDTYKFFIIPFHNNFSDLFQFISKKEHSGVIKIGGSWGAGRSSLSFDMM